MIAALALGCAGDIAVDGRGSALRYRHKDVGYRIPPPPSEDGFAWERFELEGADLAFRERASAAPGTTLSLLSRCRPTRASARILSRSLLGRVPREAVEHAGPLAVHGREGYTQTFRAGDSTRVKTVTVVEGRCTYDWLLVASESAFAPALRLFDRWWQAFEFAGPE